ncbi:unnamed protein product [Rotaria sordida]|uniref:beta-N-acetylhexosaminidase n=1 Tax=Rotaria sordida TaxID=392033 RepID=A0A818M115_9BILA|nr:unnamed protein product [Rotaria sordida]CAF3580728.1 unnamed protein product [Rotaria sordida]
MFPIRRCNTLLSRIFLVVILFSISIFVINGFTKYFYKTDNHQYVLARNKLLEDHQTEHEHNHQKSPSFIHRELFNVNTESIVHTSAIESRHVLQENNSSTSELTKIANRPVSVYVHFDLKGAAPKISYFEQLFPLLHKWGANGICMEYEDMFPFDGIVSNIRHKQAYTKDDIEKINKLAKDNQLDIMPLLQTYGHLEFLLKLKEFSDLRENPKYPQVITPCINKTYSVLFAMIDQYLNLHPNLRLFHIGHDEVYYFLTNPACQEFQQLTGIRTQHDLFAYHLGIITNYIREKNPNISLFVWHDVLQNLNSPMLQKYKLMDIINPVLWSYREDVHIEGFVVGPQSILFGQFKSLWGASAFKGATDEVAIVSDVKHYYENQVSWIEQLNSYIPTKWKNFDGIILTGWSRYDHFLSLCELLPYSIPSMAFSLAAWKEPFKSLPKLDIFSNKQLQEYVEKELQCSSHIHLSIHEHLTKPMPKCKFPGAGVYESMISLHSLWSQVEQVELFVNKYVTDLHVKYSYIHVKRGEECLEKLTPIMNLLNNFIESFKRSMNEVFPEQVAIEWLETYFMKRYRLVNERYEFIRRAVQEQRSWLPRPIPDTDKLDINQKNKR